MHLSLREKVALVLTEKLLKPSTILLLSPAQWQSGRFPILRMQVPIQSEAIFIADIYY